MLRVLGRNPPPQLKSTEGVELKGFVPDIVPYLQKTTIFVSPVPWGSGIKTKNLEAMSLGLPVVTTTCGADGINAVDGESIMIADTPQEFANKILNLLDNRELRDRVGYLGREIIRKGYSWDTVFNELERVYEELCWETP
jgi:glycosyltransferase involved in cell wall biosynthesis